jgi:soluble lytic murein transglycosylase
MRTPTTSQTIADDTLRRGVLGFAVLLVTVGSAYTAARTVDMPKAIAALVGSSTEEADAAVPDPPIPTRDEIHAHIEEVAAEYKLSPQLVAAIIDVESEFNPRAVSRRGAQGLMQLMPETAATLDVQDSFDARENIEGGVKHLKALLERFRGNVPLAVAAYNAGEQAVITHRGIPPYPETRRYVISVMRRVDREAARAVAQQIAASMKPPARPMTVRPASSPARPAPARTVRPTTTPAPAVPRPAAGREAEARRDGATELYAAFVRTAWAGEVETSAAFTPAHPLEIAGDLQSTGAARPPAGRATAALPHQGP